jgi:hypothetical protein
MLLVRDRKPCAACVGVFCSAAIPLMHWFGGGRLQQALDEALDSIDRVQCDLQGQDASCQA